MIPTMFSSSPPPASVEEFRGIMLEIHPAGLRAMARSVAEADLREVLSRITVPTLLLYGTKTSVLLWRSPRTFTSGSRRLDSSSCRQSVT